MRVIICGAGQVGLGIAERLAAEGNTIAIIDNRPDVVQRANDTLDVRAHLGYASHPDVLDRAGARETDMLIAVTLNDEVNIVACQVASALFEIPTRIARVRAQAYMRPDYEKLLSKDALGIDHVISPEVEVGNMVMRRLDLPGAFEHLRFANDVASGLGIHCQADCPILDTPLRQLGELFPDLSAVIVGIVREGKLLIPHSDDQLVAGDNVYVVADTAQVQRVLKIFGHEETRSQRIVIAGGGNVGLYVAQRIEAHEANLKLKLIEASRPRAVEIAEHLTRSVVLHGSALSDEVLREAEVPVADTMVTLTNDDQVNILSAVLAKQLGCKRNLCLINNPSYAGMGRAVGIDSQINPRAITVSKILQYVRRGRIQSVHAVHNGEGEFIEAQALETAAINGQPLRELDLSGGWRIGAVIRKGKIIIPNGQTVIMPEDRAIVFARASAVREVEQQFRVSLEFVG